MYKIISSHLDDYHKAHHYPQPMKGESENRALIIQARISNPCATLEGIAQQVNLTRERVRQVLKKAGLPTRGYVQRYVCLNCGKVKKKNSPYCNKKCRHEYTHIKVACIQCGVLTEHNAKNLLWQIEHKRRSTDKYFCSHQCQGRWLGENYGFQPGYRGGQRKHDWDAIWQKHLETGMEATALHRNYFPQIPRITLWAILSKQRGSVK